MHLPGCCETREHETGVEGHEAGGGRDIEAASGGRTVLEGRGQLSSPPPRPLNQSASYRHRHVSARQRIGMERPPVSWTLDSSSRIREAAYQPMALMTRDGCPHGRRPHGRRPYGRHLRAALLLANVVDVRRPFRGVLAIYAIEPRLLLFNVLGADALRRRPLLTQVKRQSEPQQGGDGGADEILDPMFPYVLEHSPSLNCRRPAIYERRMTSVTTSETNATLSVSTLYGWSSSVWDSANPVPSIPPMVRERRLISMAAWASVVT